MAAISKCSDEKNGDVTVKKRKGRVPFDYPTDGCICTYESHTGLQKHLDISNHVRRLHGASQCDHITRQYADMVSDERSNQFLRRILKACLQSTIGKVLARSSSDGR